MQLHVTRVSWQEESTSWAHIDHGVLGGQVVKVLEYRPSGPQVPALL